jgi:hypothetical protein
MVNAAGKSVKKKEKMQCGVFGALQAAT